METEGALALLAGDRTWLLPAGPPNPPANPTPPLLDAALGRAARPPTRFQPRRPRSVADLARAGKAQAAVLVRPVAVRQIAAAARAGHRMPAKTTFFAPKPRTGLVFRRLHD